MLMKRMIVCFAVLGILSLMAGTNASASLIATLGSDADTYIRDATVRGAYEFMDIRGATSDFTGYVQFDLSSLNITSISSATLTLTVSGGASRNDSVVAGRFALYGLDNVAGNTPQNWDETVLSKDNVGVEWTTNSAEPLVNVTDLDGDVLGITETVPGSSATGGKVTVTGNPLASFILGRVNDNGLVTFILRNDDTADRGYGLGTKENLTESYRPTLTLDYIPEPATMTLLGLGGLSLLRIRKRTLKN